MMKRSRSLAAAGKARKLRLWAAALAGALALAAAGAGPASAASLPWKVSLYTTVGTSNAGLVGHVYVQLRHGSQNLIFGKYPGGNFILNTDGAIKDDGGRGWSWRITWEVNHDQWGIAKSYLEEQQRRPDNYKLLSDNCVQFAVDVARRAGVSPPNYTSAGVPDPTALRDSLRSIGNDKRFEYLQSVKPTASGPHAQVDVEPAPPPELPF